MTAPKDASHEEALTALQAATARPVVSEPLQLKRRLAAELKETPLEQALQEASRSFHLYVLQRPGSLAFQRRYLDDRELSDLELQEIQHSAAAVYRLVHGICPWRPDITETTDQNDFARSLTPEQQQGMLGDGLPFVRLTPAQRALWLKINLRWGYSDLDMEQGRVDSLFRFWSRAALEYRAVAPEANLLWFTHPNPKEPDSDGGVSSFTFLDPAIEPQQPGPASPAGVSLPAERQGLPPAFRKKVRLKNGPMALKDVLKAIESASGFQIEEPPYASERRLVAAADGCTANDLLVALTDLYGWVLRSASGKRYFLGPPTPAPAKDPMDLYHKLRAALPPAFLRLASREAEARSGARYSFHSRQILAEIDRAVKPGWKAVRVTELAPDLQRRLANLLFWRRQVGLKIKAVWKSQPAWCLVSPEQGYFKLSGEMGPGKHPFLLFRVRRPDGQEDEWGWGVGTSSLEQ